MQRENSNAKDLLNTALYLTIYTLFSLTIINEFKTGIDVYWHIKAGQWIVQNLNIPEFGIFTYTKLSTSWTNSEWLSQVFIYIIFYLSGWYGLLIMTLVSTIATLLIINIQLSKYTSNIRCLILISLSFIMLEPHILPRPHILSLPILAFFTTQLINCSEKGTSPSYLNLILILIWANLHGSFIVGLGLIVFFATESIFAKDSWDSRLLIFKKWGLFFMAALGCSMLTPNGIEGLLFPFKVSNQNYALGFINEWLSPNFQEFTPLELWLLLFLSISLLSGLKLPPLRIILLLALIHLSLKHSRYVSDLMSIITPLVLIPSIEQALPSGKAKAAENPLLIAVNYKIIALVLILFLSISFSIQQIRLPSESEKKFSQILTAIHPYVLPSENIFNSYGLGGLLIFHNYMPFVDGRSELFGDAYLIKHQNAIHLRNSDSYTTLDQEHNFTWTFLSPTAPLNSYLELHPEWQCVFLSKHLSVYTRINKLSEIKPLSAYLDTLANNQCTNH